MTMLAELDVHCIFIIFARLTIEMLRRLRCENVDSFGQSCAHYMLVRDVNFALNYKLLSLGRSLRNSELYEYCERMAPELGCFLL